MSDPISTESFISSIGVNTHMDAFYTNYADNALVASDLAYLGVDLVRDLLPGDATAETAPFVTLAAAGVKFDFIVNGQNIPVSTMMTDLDTMETLAPGSIAAVEGPNEVNLNPVTYDNGTGDAAAAALQAALYTAVHADPNLAGVPVYALTVGGGAVAEEDQIGNISAYADYGNAHIYPDYGAPPYPYWFPSFLSQQEIPTGSDPMVITEWGYATVNNPAEYGIDDTTQADYTLDVLFDAKAAGVQTTYLYELLDQDSSPTTLDVGYHFGLFNSDGTPKLAATAIHNLTSILADTGAVPPGGTLDYSLANLTNASGNSLLMEKSTGAFDLAVWAEPVAFDTTTYTDVAVPNDAVTVDLGAQYTKVEVFDPLIGATPIATYANVGSVTIDITDHPLIVEVEPGSTVDVPTNAAVFNVVNTDATVRAATAGHTIDVSGAIDSVIDSGGANTIVGGANALTVTLEAAGSMATAGTGALAVSDIHGGNLISAGASLTLDGAGAADTVVGAQAGSDIALDRPGNVVLSGAGGLTVSAGAGGNLVLAGAALAFGGAAGANTILGGQTALALALSGSGNVVSSGSGDLNIADSAGGNIVFARSALTFAGTAGGDTIVGGAGAAYAQTTGGQNIAFGGSGDLTLVNAAGSATVLGGAGNLAAFGGSGALEAFAGAGPATLVGGSAGGNILVAGAGASTLVAGGGGDQLYATGSVGSLMFAGAGEETLYAAGSTSANTIIGGAGGALIADGNAGDLVVAGSGADTVFAGGGADTLIGTGGANVFALGAGSADVFAAGQTTVFGGAGPSIVQVESGAAVVMASAGAMTIAAGGSLDLFVFTDMTAASGAAPRDLIFNFTPGADFIDLQGFGANAAQAAIAGATISDGGETLHLSDGASIVLVGVTGLTANAFA